MYYLITLSRNILFDLNILKSKKYPVPVICVGNLSTGGTGKSPMTEYIVRLVQQDFKTATLSRGYGRQTTGYLDVTAEHTAAQVGDEPLQFARKFADVQVAVCEDRQTGIETLLAKEDAPQVIILDDAFQHRKVEAHLNILLTAYGDLYVHDYVLPVGNLREPRKGAARANIVVVTKCPETLSATEQVAIASQLALQSHQQVYFSKIVYDDQVHTAKGAVSLNSLKVKKVTLVTGIANPKPLVEHLKKEGLSVTHKSYSDHHNFTASEIGALEKLDCILTTEKDYVRLRPLLQMNALYCLPIRIEFLKQALVFDQQIKSFVEGFTT